ncbi:MAG: tRNA (adenosine(37)-N6)-threonylcarbamoyltransferase complex dimerization subunit type 1 TsaB [Clostridiales Family XIII bacterium]|jgi:tRNA threonylcarbamoyladenosine biosynthesis protein TsaB|nr:tRNA (adenosine(37)-N6)-threonylcarbamoyltransferase complex dimerization subunit type 1 TsaB [Clostridiales Family XIII bacterium]
MNQRFPNLLAIETTGRTLSAAMMREGAAVVEKRAAGELNHLTGLVPMISQLLCECGMELPQLDAIAVSSGPGSFTGIRIGISAARAMAQVTGLPVVKVPTLETFVYNFSDADAGAVVCPVFDARRSQMYAGAYRLAGGQPLETLVEGAAWEPETFMRELAQAARARQCGSEIITKLFFCGDGTEIFAERIAEGAEELDMEIYAPSDARSSQSAASVLRWAQSYGKPIGYAALEPIYMRKAEAQRKLEERLAADGKVGGA